MQNSIEILEKPKLQDMWTLFLADFRAKIYPLQEKWQELKGKEADFGLKCFEFVGKLDRNTSSLKTAQLCLFEDLNKSYATFPKSGMMQNGKCLTAKISESPKTEKGSTLSDILEEHPDPKYFLSKEQTEKILKSWGQSPSQSGQDDMSKSEESTPQKG